MAEDKDALKKKIAALFAKAESTSQLGNQKEAEAFMAKAQELLTKHSLEKENLEEADKAKGMTIPFEDWYRKSESDWLNMLFHVLAKYHHCSMIIDNKRKAWVIVGAPENAETVAYMGITLVPKIRKMCNEACKENWEGNPNTFKRGYFRGFPLGLRERLEQQWNEQMSESQRAIDEARTTGNLPAPISNLPRVIAHNQGLIQEFYKKHYPHLGKAGFGKTKLQGVSGFAMGKEAGSKESLSRRRMIG
jgi:hypothetical protein